MSYLSLLKDRPEYCLRIESLSSPAVAVQDVLAFLMRNVHKRVVTFGRHRGQAYGEVVISDFQYCQWSRRTSRNGPLQHFTRYLEQCVPSSAPNVAAPTPV